jgi:hypothetical protein
VATQDIALKALSEKYTCFQMEITKGNPGATAAGWPAINLETLRNWALRPIRA